MNQREERTNLIEQLCDLLEIRMKHLLKKKGITLEPRSDRQSRCCKFKLQPPKDELSMEERLMIMDIFDSNYESFGLTCNVQVDCICFGFTFISNETLATIKNTLQSDGGHLQNADEAN